MQLNFILSFLTELSKQELQSLYSNTLYIIYRNKICSSDNNKKEYQNIIYYIQDWYSRQWNCILKLICDVISLIARKTRFINKFIRFQQMIKQLCNPGLK